MNDWERREEIAAKIRKVTDRVHELLNGPDGEVLSGDAEREQMRIVLNILKAWIHLAASLEMTGALRAAGRYGFADLEGEGWDLRKTLARRWLSRELDNAMHAELHELCAGPHPFRFPLKGTPVEAEPDILKTAQAIFDDMPGQFGLAADQYNRAVWAGDDRAALRWRAVFTTLENLWISAKRDISDAGEYDMMQSCAMYIAGGCDMSPEEEAAAERQMRAYVESGSAARDADDSERRHKFCFEEEEDDFPF